MPKNIIQTKKTGNPIQLFFQDNEETRKVEVIKFKEINLEELKRHLEKGESLFMIQNQKKKPEINLINYNITKKS